MNYSDNTPGPVLAIEIGKVYTRALLLDIVKENYRLLGVGKANTTLGNYGTNLRHGVRVALEELQAITGSVLINSQKELIQPVTKDGSGVSQCITTISAGPPLKIYLAGLLKDVSLSSMQRMVMRSFAGQVKTTSLSDNPKKEVILDEILKYRPDLIIIAGGTSSGASRSVVQLLEPVQMAFLLVPDEYRPEVLFVGNQVLHPIIQTVFKSSSHVHLGPNLRPDIDTETLAATATLIEKIIVKIRIRQLPGLSDLLRWSQGNMFLSAAGLGHMISYLSQTHNTGKGVLGVDIGASSTTIAAAFGGRLSISVFSGFGSPEKLIDPAFIQELRKWLISADISDESILKYAFNKLVYPACLPLTDHDLAIQNAFARLAIQDAIKELSGDFPADIVKTEDGQLPWVEPILAGGSLLVDAASPGLACLMLLDGLQPTGVTTLVLDRSQIAGIMGAVASVNHAAAVQVLDSDVFLHLATVISPMGHASAGMPILRSKMTRDDGHEIIMDVKQGELDLIPLPPGHTAQIQLQPYHRYDIGMGGPGRGGSLRVSGSILGIVIDGRGRPLKLPAAPDRCRELQRKWLWMLGG